MKRTLLWFTIAVFSLVGSGVGFLAWCGFGSGFVLITGPIDHVEEFPSPDGSRKAVLYRLDGNAISDYSWQLCVLDAHQSLPRWRRPVFTTNGDLSVSARWIDPLHLTVVYGPGSYSDGGGAARRISSFGPVHIVYHYVP